MFEFSLNELYNQFSLGVISRDELEGFIYNYYFYNQEKTYLAHWKREEYEDYVSWFYPRLRKAIDSYKDRGSTFEAFMGKFTLLSSKEYRVRLITNNVTEYYAWSARVPELYAHEEPPEYLHDNVENRISVLITDQRGRKNTRRLLALILKCYYYISDDFIEKIAPKLGIDSKQLREMVNNIQKTRRKKDDAIYMMKERIYRQFYRCLILEKKLSLEQENTTMHDKLKEKLEKTRFRLEKMRESLQIIRTDASNRQVAEAIGIKKGTVDASLHRLKIKWKILSADKSFLN